MASATVGVDRRPGRSARRIVRREVRQALRRNWKPLTVGLLGWVAIGVGLATWQLRVAHSVWASGFTIGLLLGALPFLWQSFLAAQGLAYRALGADAEGWTGAELRKLPGRHWRVFHDVWVGGFNVDHVAVAGSRIYAIETKWVSRPPSDRTLKAHGRLARARAAALGDALSRRGVAREVTPLLVLWGRVGTEAVPESGRHLQPMRVTAVVGHDSSTWLARMDEAGRGPVLDGPALQILNDLQCAPIDDDSLSTSGS